MEINQISSPFVHNSEQVNTPLKTPAQAQESFKAAFQEALNAVNEAQHESQQKTQLLATGNIEDLHEVMIAGQKASITLQATVEVRNKVVEAYQEIMRMQV
ncbi:flagellar hook-basal body complex protein FliE [Alkalihalobacillus trypoxylicola]|uniref:Flagellar hook-basal body complex protein FliE n=1 Tax=Alkalihalobacillus trypoxylicola TaxID=519424 RepID=A0A162F8U4_9BACI|nr:flagellar hook-basal body complex protein FliE [Alkalihalobacillus trypoxylicola]KYG35061.1 flagellar hook-basal body protein FliE [Alkalihalobacillus trypoxylicola]GAF63718.1 flagellar hook-basal body protein FliE [Bacillus sp. TS-2]